MNLDMQLIIKTNNPYDYNSVVAKQMEKKNEEKNLLTPTASSMLQDPTVNMLGKFLGVDTKQEWNLQYDKVWLIYSWAKEVSKSDDINKLVDVIKQKLNDSPAMATRRIDDLVINIKLDPKLRSSKEDTQEDKQEEEKQT